MSDPDDSNAHSDSSGKGFFSRIASRPHRQPSQPLLSPVTPEAAYSSTGAFAKRAHSTFVIPRPSDFSMPDFVDRCDHPSPGRPSEIPTVAPPVSSTSPVAPDHILDEVLPLLPMDHCKSLKADDAGQTPLPPPPTDNDKSVMTTRQSSGNQENNLSKSLFRRLASDVAPTRILAEELKEFEGELEDFEELEEFEEVQELTILPVEVSERVMVPDPIRILAFELGEANMVPNPAKVLQRINGEPKWRWYLQQKTENSCLGSLNTDPSPPVSITLDKEWTAILEMGDINSGWYSVVICISIEVESNRKGGISEADFDVCQFDGFNRPVYTEKTYRTVAGGEELRQIRNQKEKRIRLHRQIELSRGGFIKFTAILRAFYVEIARVHYIELQQMEREPDDIALYGAGKPSEVILVGTRAEETVKKHLTIHTHDIS
ncbi:hypothetical protein BGZ99_001631, partial [Dissophora globulifera]